MLGCLRTQKYLLVPKHNHFTILLTHYPIITLTKNNVLMFNFQWKMSCLHSPGCSFCSAQSRLFGKGTLCCPCHLLRTHQNRAKLSLEDCHHCHPTDFIHWDHGHPIHPWSAGFIQLDWCNARNQRRGHLPKSSVLSWRTASWSRRWSLGLCERGPSKRPQLQRNTISKQEIRMGMQMFFNINHGAKWLLIKGLVHFFVHIEIAGTVDGCEILHVGNS